jgi:pentatricopeptide repeat protein
MHNILISVCTKCGKMDEALDLVKKMSRENSQLQQHTMNSLTRALSVQSPIRAVRMMSLMQAMGMQPSRSTRLTVLKECSLSGDVMEALSIYQSLLACGMDLDGSSGSALICSLCQAQQLEEAVKVYDRMMTEAWMGRTGKALLPKRAHVPDGMALSSLAQSHAAAGLLNHAWKYYMQLKRRERSLQRATVTHRRLFEALIEGYCRRQNLKRALLVFDDWKSASAQWCTQSEASRIKSLQQTTSNREASSLARDQTKNENDRSKPATDARSPNQNRRKYPKLSYVTLAYLEASCRKDADLSWRVYDVMAVMRAQKETKLQSELARPPKASHHVATESSDS